MSAATADVALDVAVSTSCARRGEEEDDDPLLVFIHSEEVFGRGGLWWAEAVGCLVGSTAGLAAGLRRPGEPGRSLSPFSFSVLYFMFSIPFVELKFEFNPTLQMFLYISIRS
jgi:hypothetical protein